MELLSENFVRQNCFKISSLLKYVYETKNNSSFIIYDEFKQTIIDFIEKTMRNYLLNTEYYTDNVKCVVLKMEKNLRGDFDSKYNKIRINEDVINELFKGNILEFTTIMHELNHFKIKYDLRLGVINQDLVRIAKEKLLSITSDSLFGKKYNTCSYYQDNYGVDSEEKTVEIAAINDLIHFFHMSEITLNKNDFIKLNESLKKEKRQYENHLRDLRGNINFNNYWLELEEAFEVMLHHNPNWLNCPQIGIEYFKDDTGVIRKRNKSELIEIYKSNEDEETKKYINILLNSNHKVDGSKKDFIVYNDEIKIENKEELYQFIKNRR